MLFEVFDDSIGLETRVQHNAVILTGPVDNVAIFVEWHRNDGAYLQLLIGQNKHPFHQNARLTTIFPVGSAPQDLVVTTRRNSRLYPLGPHGCECLPPIRHTTERTNGFVFTNPA